MEKYYSVAVRKKRNHNDCFMFDKEFKFHEVKIDTKGKYWIADPFLFENDGITYLFYEALDLYLKKGVIAYSVLNDDYTATEPKVIINEKYHLSFPYIFEDNGQIYIMPESCGKDDVHIYKAVKFPDIWKEDRVLVDNVFVADSILLRDNNEEVYLFSSEQYRHCPSDKVISCWVKNRLFRNVFNDKDITGDVIFEGDLGIRNAGGVFKAGDNLYRPGQNSPNGKYGKGLRFFRIESVIPYIEHDCYKIDCEEMQNHIEFIETKSIVGTHTYNSTDKYEVIDLSYFSDNTIPIDLYRNFRRVLRFGKRTLLASVQLSNKAFNAAKWKLNKKKHQSYYAEINKSAPWVFVSYIADPFYRNDDNYLNLHQNKREVMKMAEVFNSLGYNAFFCLYTADIELPDLDVKLVFGHEPNFIRACEKYPDAKKIFYGVSTYFDYRNNKIKQMTDDFNTMFDGKVPYRRLVEPHKSPELADTILLIGSQETIKTYPEEYRDKITLIHQSTQKCRSLKYLNVADGKEFIFIGSSGNALKGVGPLVKYFINHPELELHWVGPIEEEVKEALKGKITPNIHTYGFQNIGSDLVLGLFECCNFMVYPSGVEGVPGSVLNAMKSGMIPLVTPWASFDGADKLGYVMKDATVEEIGKAINWAMSLDDNVILDKKKKCKQFVNENYNLEGFKKEFEEYMTKQMGKVK